jgi:hypothetical protein
MGVASEIFVMDGCRLIDLVVVVPGWGNSLSSPNEVSVDVCLAICSFLCPFLVDFDFCASISFDMIGILSLSSVAWMTDWEVCLVTTTQPFCNPSAIFPVWTANESGAESRSLVRNETNILFLWTSNVVNQRSDVKIITDSFKFNVLDALKALIRESQS